MGVNARNDGGDDRGSIRKVLVSAVSGCGLSAAKVYEPATLLKSNAKMQIIDPIRCSKDKCNPFVIQSHLRGDMSTPRLPD